MSSQCNCPACAGYGKKKFNPGGWKTCSDCNGKGYMTHSEWSRQWNSAQRDRKRKVFGDDGYKRLFGRSIEEDFPLK